VYIFKNIQFILYVHFVQEPRGLEVFPQKGLLFWTDWGDTPHIGSMGMDGTNPKIIIQVTLLYYAGDFSYFLFYIPWTLLTFIGSMYW
jgi:hypothetical protein